MGHSRVRIWAVVGSLVTMWLSGCAVRPSPEPGWIDENGLSAYYYEQAGAEAFGVTRVRFFDNGPAIKAAMLELVDSAEDYILMDSFLLTDGPEAREILDALVAKHREGVRVHLIGDSSSRFVPEPAAFEYLAERGVPVAEFHPIRGLRAFFLPGVLERDHRKFWIVDGEVILLGGANLNDPSLVPPESGGNRDLMVGLESAQPIREMIDSFVETWNDSAKEGKLNAADFPVKSESKDGGANYWLFNQDTSEGSPSPTQVMMDGLFASARRSVWLIEPYAFVNIEILSEIEKMTSRGVEVNLILSTEARAPRFYYASHFGIKDLSEAGAKVWIFDSKVSPLHYKCALVDDRLAYVGSANLNFRSYRLARELSVAFDDPGSVAEVRKVVEDVRKESRLVPKEEARAYRKPRYFAWWLVMQTAG